MDLSPELIECMRKRALEEKIDDSEEQRIIKQKQLIKDNPPGKWFKILENTIIKNNIYPFDNGWLIPQKTHSDKLLFKELCVTFPNKDIEEKNEIFVEIEKFIEAEEWEKHFEIGKKSGIYHYHCLIASKKYLRKRDIERKCRGNRISFAKVKNLTAYRKYMIKDEHKPIPDGW